MIYIPQNSYLYIMYKYTVCRYVYVCSSDLYFYMYFGWFGGGQASTGPHTIAGSLERERERALMADYSTHSHIHRPETTLEATISGTRPKSGMVLTPLSMCTCVVVLVVVVVVVVAVVPLSTVTAVTVFTTAGDCCEGVEEVEVVRGEGEEEGGGGAGGTAVGMGDERGGFTDRILFFGASFTGVCSSKKHTHSLSLSLSHILHPSLPPSLPLFLFFSLPLLLHTCI